MNYEPLKPFVQREMKVLIIGSFSPVKGHEGDLLLFHHHKCTHTRPLYDVMMSVPGSSGTYFYF